MNEKADFYVVYRWRLKTGMEQQFTDAWSEMTDLIREQRGGLGSRLHYRDDGWWVAYAAWPSRDHWMRSKKLGPADQALAKLMNDAIVQRLQPEELLPVRGKVADIQ